MVIFLMCFMGGRGSIVALAFFLPGACGIISNMNRHKLILVLVVLAIALMPSVSWAGQPYHAKVVGISDGDTIKVLHNGTQVRIRLYGIDTPERRQASGNRAKRFTSDMVPL